MFLITPPSFVFLFVKEIFDHLMIKKAQEGLLCTALKVYANLDTKQTKRAVR